MTTHQPVDAETEAEAETVDVPTPTDDDTPTEDAPTELESDDEETPTDVEDPPPLTRRRRLQIAGTVMVGAVVLGLGGAAVAFHLDHLRAQQISDQRGAVLTAATDGTKAILSYSSTTVDADLDRASQFLTGDFRDYYRKLGSDAVAPNAKSRGLTSEASVAGASTTSLEDGSAGALVFVNQSVTPAAGTASTTSTAIRVHLTRVDGHWLIDRFEPI
ncbi:hypothetical protein [Williamsia sp. M5A3_1d]